MPLLLILILFMTLLFLRRRRYGCKRTTDARANDNMSLPDSTMETSRPVLIKNFAEHYRLMSADSDFRWVKFNWKTFRRDPKVSWRKTFNPFPPFILLTSDLAKSSKSWNTSAATSHAPSLICHAIVPRIASPTYFRTTTRGSSCSQSTTTKAQTTSTPTTCRATIRRESSSWRRDPCTPLETTSGECAGRATREP